MDRQTDKQTDTHDDYRNPLAHARRGLITHLSITKYTVHYLYTYSKGLKYCMCISEKVLENSHFLQLPSLSVSAVSPSLSSCACNVFHTHVHIHTHNTQTQETYNCSLHTHTQHHSHSGLFLEGLLILLLFGHSLHPGLVPPSEERWSVDVWVSVVFIVAHLHTHHTHTNKHTHTHTHVHM